MSGLRQRLVAFADAVQQEHPRTPAATTAKQLRVYLDGVGTSMMLRSISDPTSFEWPWMLGFWDSTYNRTVRLVRETTLQVQAQDDYSRAEVGASLLDELGTNVELADEGVETAAKVVVEKVRETIADVGQTAAFSTGSLFALYVGTRIAFAVLERR